MQRQHAPYRADVVGSFLRPDAIKQARLKFASGEIDAGQLRAVEDDAIRHVVEQQCACGLHVVTDGEFRRAWWHFDFFDGLQGVERYDSQQGIQFNGVQTKAHGVRVTGKLGFGDHPMLDDFRYLKSISGNAQPKMTIPSPSVLHFRGGRKDIDATVYPDLNVYLTIWRPPGVTLSGPSMMQAAVTCNLTTPSGPTSVRTISVVRSASAAMMPMSLRRSTPAC